MSERKGEVIDHVAIKNVCQMLMVLGINKRFVYAEDFERPFLAQSAVYYREQSEKFLSEKSPCFYFKWVIHKIIEEIKRCKLYLDKGTETRLCEVMEKELIKEHIKTIVKLKSFGDVVFEENESLEENTKNCILYIRKSFTQISDLLQEFFSECDRESMKFRSETSARDYLVWATQRVKEAQSKMTVHKYIKYAVALEMEEMLIRKHVEVRVRFNKFGVVFEIKNKKL